MLIAVYESKKLSREGADHKKGNILSAQIQMDEAEFIAEAEEFKAAADEFAKLSEVKNKENIFFQEAKYPYWYLTELMDVLNSAFTENSATGSVWQYVSSFALLDDCNTISFELTTTDDDILKQLQDEIGYMDVFSFGEALATVENNAIKAGQQMSYPGSYSSIGYRARRHLSNGTYEYGYVTTGHSIAKGLPVYQGTSVIGDCMLSSNTATLDAAFVKTRSGFDMSNVTDAGYTMTSTITNPAVSTTVSKEGSTTGRTTGTILSINASTTVNGVLCSSLYSADYLAANGDSGGIVYTGENSIVGVHKSGPTTAIAGTRYLTPATNVNIYLSGSSETITPY